MIANFVSYVDCQDEAGNSWLVRWANQAETVQEAQAEAIRHLGDSRSIPTGPGGSIRSIETVPEESIVRTAVARRDVPLFELIGSDA